MVLTEKMASVRLWQICAALLGIIQVTQGAFLRIYCLDDISLNTYEEVPLNKSELLLRSRHFDISRDNALWIHGFTGTMHGDDTISVIKKLISLGVFNVFALNWQKEAASLHDDPESKRKSYSLTAIPNMFKVGTELGLGLVRMADLGFSLPHTTIVGFSLGAHMAGHASRTANGICGERVGRILGLEPAGPFFNKPEQYRSLASGDAVAVLCAHTDHARYGSNKAICDVDLMINYLHFTLPDDTLRVQPGCPEGDLVPFSNEDLCSHFRVIALFEEGLGLVGSEACNVWDWTRGLGDCSDTVSLSLTWDTTKNGVYYLDTRSSPPYGLGIPGSCPSWRRRQITAPSLWKYFQ